VLRSLMFVFFGIAVCFCAMTSAAQAQATRTWVSGLGDDANPCSRTAPCKTFAGAYSRTAVGGEVDVIDPGGFGTISIGHSLTIDGGGGQVASILASSTSGVNINGGASDRIILRNLRINGISQSSFPGTTAIIFNSGLTLTVDTCVIENFGTNGITFQPTVKANLYVNDTVIENANNDGIIFSTAASGGGVARASLVNVKITGSGKNGIEIGANARVDIHRSVFSGNGLITTSGDGIIANGGNTGVDVMDSESTNNGGSGIHTQSTGIIRISGSNLSENGNLGVNTDTGQTFSGLNNIVQGNAGGPGTFTGPIPLQ
jgi:hypothetical protein